MNYLTLKARREMPTINLSNYQVGTKFITESGEHVSLMDIYRYRCDYPFLMSNYRTYTPKGDVYRDPEMCREDRLVEVVGEVKKQESKHHENFVVVYYDGKHTHTRILPKSEILILEETKDSWNGQIVSIHKIGDCMEICNGDLVDSFSK